MPKRSSRKMMTRAIASIVSGNWWKVSKHPSVLNFSQRFIGSPQARTRPARLMLKRRPMPGTIGKSAFHGTGYEALCTEEWLAVDKPSADDCCLKASQEALPAQGLRWGFLFAAQWVVVQIDDDSMQCSKVEDCNYCKATKLMPRQCQRHPHLSGRRQTS